MMIFDFFEVFVVAYFRVGLSDEHVAATSFKAVVRDFSNLGAAVEL